MRRYTGNILHPLVKGFQVAVCIEELCRHVLTHHVNLEGCKHFIGVPQVLVEETVMCWRCLCLSKPFHCSLVDDTQHLTPDAGLYLAGCVEAVIYFAQELAEDIGIETDGVSESSSRATAYRTTVAIVVAIVDRID